jgi:hypothetical protein
MHSRWTIFINIAGNNGRANLNGWFKIQKRSKKNIINATPTTYSPLIQGSNNLDDDNVVFGDHNKTERLISRKAANKQAKKDNGCTSFYVGLILKD